MPIYAYRCASCGHAKDVLQKLSDDALTVCPACGAAEFSKQLTAAGFQLKGSGWYVTDFRDGNNGKKDAKKEGDEAPGDKADAKAAEKPTEGAKDAAPAKVAESTAAAAPPGPASPSAPASSASPAPAPATKSAPASPAPPPASGS
jgi:putative FmdB family regulatory protein